MRVIIEDIQPGEEEMVILRCTQVDPALLKLINSMKNGAITLTANQDGKWHRVLSKDIYYFESVDHRVFLYTEAECMECRQKLYELEDLLSIDQFYRISKSVIVNLQYVKTLAPAFHGRLEATLTNGEKLIISRQYVSSLKEILGL
ncbi:MAG: LytTR family transcriptional regulator DNA-binding domain-containing protein [Lachnospiraceae bacterium]|jgi:DNA-binding LytR/AlgR family response regulator|nr:LytTR family transcriptional regulator DNA-binding domain-containing protein [Lachnospiraceae bacterium]